MPGLPPQFERSSPALNFAATDTSHQPNADCWQQCGVQHIPTYSFSQFFKVGMSLEIYLGLTRRIILLCFFVRLRLPGAIIDRQALQTKPLLSQWMSSQKGNLDRKGRFGTFKICRKSQAVDCPIVLRVCMRVPVPAQARISTCAALYGMLRLSKEFAHRLGARFYTS